MLAAGLGKTRLQGLVYRMCKTQSVFGRRFCPFQVSVLGLLRNLLMTGCNPCRRRVVGVLARIIRRVRGAREQTTGVLRKPTHPKTLCDFESKVIACATHHQIGVAANTLQLGKLHASASRLI